MFQSPDDAEALGATIMSVEEKMALCDVIFQDLLVVQRILKVSYVPVHRISISFD